MLKKMGWMLALGLLSAAPLAAGPDGLKASVVKVYVVQKPADYYQPWQMGYQMPSSGSGLVLEGGKILTNAHVVSDQVHIQVMKAGDTHKATAHVLFVGHDTDLALLSVDEPGFFEGTKPVSFGPMPRQRDRVAAYGFPAGGDELSITEGVVSRIEVRTYAHAGGNLLTAQTDAAINPGNSGGPVFKDGKFVGVSFQGYSGAALQNTGYFIPVVVVDRFLKDVADGSYDGVPGMGVIWNKLENPALRTYLGLKNPRGGVQIGKVIPQTGAADVFKAGDVLLSLDGVPIAENGTVPYGEGDRVDLAHLVTMHQMSETAKALIWRDGKEQALSVPLRGVPDLVPGPEYDQRPPYLVYAGLVFQSLNANFVRLFENGVPIRMRVFSEMGLVGPEREEVVFINVVLPHEVNVGYHKISQAIVSKVNGQEIKKLKDVADALPKPLLRGGKRYLVVELDHWNGAPDNRATEIVLDADAAAKAQPEILKAFGIAEDRSKDLQDEAVKK